MVCLGKLQPVNLEKTRGVLRKDYDNVTGLSHNGVKAGGNGFGLVWLRTLILFVEMG